MKNMKLKVRLFGGFGAILLAISICSGYALVGMNHVKRDATVVVSDNLPGIYNVGRLQFLTATNLSTVKEATVATDPLKVAGFSELIRTRSVEVKATLKAYEDAIFVDEDRALFRKVTEALDPWVRARDGSMALAGAGKTVEARRLLEEEGEPAFAAYQAALKALAAFNNTHADEGVKNMTSTLASVSATIEVGMVLAVLIGLVIATLISRSISQPVGQVLQHVERVGRGDLESRCAYDSRDEIGALAAETNKMAEDSKRARDAERLKVEEDNRRQAELQGKVDQLLTAVKDIGRGDLTTDIAVRGTDAVGQLGEGLTQLVDDLNRNMSAISRNAQTLASSSEQLTSASQQMSANCEETSAQAGTVSSASEQLSKNVQTVAAASEQMSVSIKEIAGSAQRATTVATSAVRAVEKTSATIAKLGASSAEIGEVINLITSIAAQTNLLALNATIEAARAGDAGKGFAVVASEVKELAKATAKATEDIGHRIGAIQADSTEAVRAIGEIRQVIDQVNELSLTIASAVEEQTSTTNEIGRNVAEAAKGTDEIARNITGVAQAAHSTAAGSTQTQASAESLGKMAADLQGLVSRFKLDDGAPAARGPRLSSVSHQTTAWKNSSAA